MMAPALGLQPVLNQRLRRQFVGAEVIGGKLSIQRKR
jgi:hypothetical protein